MEGKAANYEQLKKKRKKARNGQRKRKDEGKDESER